jgi:dimethylaniline monooxygenase (N-oxide forming)
MSEGHRAETKFNETRSKFVNVVIKDTKGRRIDVVRWPKGIDEDGIMSFEERQPHDAVSQVTQVKPDVVVFATGFESEFSYLDSDYPQLAHASVRGIYKEKDISVGFIGFVRPSIGKFFLYEYVLVAHSDIEKELFRL